MLRGGARGARGGAGGLRGGARGARGAGAAGRGGAAEPSRGVRAEAGVDVVLSSGFLAFAHHLGFLQAVERQGLGVRGVMGTSAGALVGSLYAAGLSPEAIEQEMTRVPPIELLSPPVGEFPPMGLCSLAPLVQRLRKVLPGRFEDLELPFACAVVDRGGRHRVVDSGSLPEAVAASAAIPVLFHPVDIPGCPGGPFADGGKVDRDGLGPWRDLVRAKGWEELPAVVHLISRSSPLSGEDNVYRHNERNIAVVRSAKSGMSLFSLGDFAAQRAAAAVNAQGTAGWVARELKKRKSNPSPTV